mmetsp:Transcript_27889/g.54234  ORF Transcript_27889/g.54234 Transcript_27889/m.54234 type:complete len:127 (+) Transcript_27889:32-412(+)
MAQEMEAFPEPEIHVDQEGKHFELIFDYAGTKKIIQKQLSDALGGKDYDAKESHGWNSLICENVLKELPHSKPFKYIVTCVIMQKSGAGLHTASLAHWDSQADGSASCNWSNTSLLAICTVFAIHR